MHATDKLIIIESYLHFLAHDHRMSDILVRSKLNMTQLTLPNNDSSVLPENEINKTASGIINATAIIAT